MKKVLDGKKTVAGAVGYGAIEVLYALGYIPMELAGALRGIFGTLFGIGVAHKFEKAKPNK